MTRIANLQQRLVEVGRCRIGTSEPFERDGRTFRKPKRLATFRFTSADTYRLGQVAELYGGTVAEWPERRGQSEVVTDVDRLPVVLIRGHTLSGPIFEMWGQPRKRGPVVCLRRCDGVTEQITDGPCLCPDDDHERAEQAKKGQACSRMTRLSFILRDVPGIGCWRLDTQGWYASTELAGVVDFLEGVAQTDVYPAILRIDQRERTTAEGTRLFPVPVLELDELLTDLVPVGPRRNTEAAGAVLSAEEPAGRRINQTPEPRALRSPETAAERMERGADRARELAGATTTRPNTPSFGEAGWEPEEASEMTAPPAEGGDEAPDTTGAPAPVTLTESQRRMLHARKRELELQDDELKELIELLTGQRSTTGIPVGQLDDLLGLMAERSQMKKAAPGSGQLGLQGG